jgi:serine/threonine protein kinase
MTTYTHVAKLGKGGNGLVWKVTDGKNEYAKKTIHKTKRKFASKRFKDEIEVIKNVSHSGIIQILDSFISSKNDEESYYIMPLGTPLKQYLQKGISLDEKFTIISKIIDAVEFLHSKNITHRDIKIENIIMIGSEPKISDFGLANFPKQERISKTNEKIGPTFTIAPEMRRISSNAEYKKADIYSLAKTLWVILTKEWLSFDGQYNSTSSIALKNHVEVMINKTIIYGVTYFHSIVILEKLLSDSTHNNAQERPYIEDFKDRFTFWLKSNNDFKLRNGIEWRDALDRIFPVSIPVSCNWKDINQMVQVLNIIFSNYDNLNHAFFPRSGGMDFIEVSSIKYLGSEYMMINNQYLMVPEVLYFESIDDLDWSYFRLELRETSPIFGMDVRNNEEYLCLDNNQNFTRSNLFINDPDIDELDLNEIRLFLKGSFMIVQKTAKINNLDGSLNHYRAIHDQMTHAEYKIMLEQVISKYKNYI